MWRLAIVILLAASAGSQEVPDTDHPQSDVTIQNPGPEVAPVRTVTRYDKLRRGHDEQIAIVPQRPLITRTGCPVMPCPTVTIIPESLHLETQKGFSFKYFVERKFKAASSTRFATTRGGGAFLVQIKAARDVPPGSYTIKGKLRRFRAENGVRSSEEVDVAIPVTVVDDHAQVTKNEWKYKPYGDDSFLTTLGVIALLPFIVVGGTIMLIACHGDGSC